GQKTNRFALADQLQTGPSGSEIGPGVTTTFHTTAPDEIFARFARVVSHGTIKPSLVARTLQQVDAWFLDCFRQIRGFDNGEISVEVGVANRAALVSANIAGDFSSAFRSARQAKPPTVIAHDVTVTSTEWLDGVAELLR